MTATAVVWRFPLNLRSSPKLTGPPDDRAVEQTTIGQILQQRCHGLIHFGQFLTQRREVLLMGIPPFVVDRDEGYTALHKAACCKT